MAKIQYFDLFILCIGIGKAISIAFNAKYPTDVHFIIFDKLGDLLNSTSQLLLSNSNNLNQVKPIEIDFSEKHSSADYKALLQPNLPSQEEIGTDYGQLICVFNHGTLEYGSVNEMAEQGLVNLFGVVLAGCSHHLSAKEFDQQADLCEFELWVCDRG